MSVPASPPVRPELMGIVNVTPDSFSDGGEYLDPQRAIAHGLQLVEDGAAILDVGGESTRPGADPVALEDELDRVIPVIKGLSGHTSRENPVYRISVDTTKPEVAEAALDAGATIVNDVSALAAGPEIAELCAKRGAGLILMHMQGTPKTMQANPSYSDVVHEVSGFLAERAGTAIAAGLPRERVWIDPGIGFGKTVGHNLALLKNVDTLADLGYRVVIGTSRKGFIGSFDGSGPDRRLGGTIASSMAAWNRGASVLRVHDVFEVRQAVAVAAAIRVA